MRRSFSFLWSPIYVNIDWIHTSHTLHWPKRCVIGSIWYRLKWCTNTPRNSMVQCFAVNTINFMNFERLTAQFKWQREKERNVEKNQEKNTSELCGRTLVRFDVGELARARCECVWCLYACPKRCDWTKASRFVSDFLTFCRLFTLFFPSSPSLPHRLRDRNFEWHIIESCIQMKI